jgi:hypothetical protein
MIPVSTRYAIPLSLILLPPLLISTFHLNFRSRVDDCALPGALYDTGRISGSQADPESLDRHSTDIIQWSEGLVPVDSPEVAPLEFRIIRSHNPKPLYGYPKSYLREKIVVEWGEVQRVSSGDDELPIHVLYGHTDYEITLGAYLFVYDSRPVENPYLTQLTGVFSHLLGGGHPLTLFTISGSARGPLFELTDETAKAWLVSAWEYYDSICSP